MTSIHPFLRPLPAWHPPERNEAQETKPWFRLVELLCETQNAETMFATAVLWARKQGPRPIKLSNLGEQVEIAAKSLHNILEQQGPLTVADCWNRASQMENNGLKSKRHMKMMLRWMRERRAVRIICQHGEGGNPNDREFLFTVAAPIVDREPRVTDANATPAE